MCYQIKCAYADSMFIIISIPQPLMKHKGALNKSVISDNFMPLIITHKCSGTVHQIKSTVYSLSDVQCVFVTLFISVWDLN